MRDNIDRKGGQLHENSILHAQIQKSFAKGEKIF